MITLGQTYTLRIVKFEDFGLYVDAGDELGDVLVPKRYAPKDVELGDEIEVFLYLDSEDRPIATTQIPKVKVGQFAFLDVVDTNNVGAFLDWGLDKDLLVPFGEQHRPMEKDKSYLVYVYINKADNRITATSKIDKILDDDAPHTYRPQQAVNLIIANSTDLGYKAIINHSHWGLLYKNEVNERLSFGQSINGFIKYIRPEDQKISLSLHSGQEVRDQNSTIVLEKLKQANGFLPFHDKSDAQLIANTFGISKVAFKKAIGALYKQRVIRIETDGIHLLNA